MHTVSKETSLTQNQRVIFARRETIVGADENIKTIQMIYDRLDGGVHR